MKITHLERNKIALFHTGWKFTAAQVLKCSTFRALSLWHRRYTSLKGDSRDPGNATNNVTVRTLQPLPTSLSYRLSYIRYVKTVPPSSPRATAIKFSNLLPFLNAPAARSFPPSTSCFLSQLFVRRLFSVSAHEFCII